MKVKYFQDTDTALVEFNNNTVHETKEINENIIIDLDKEGNLVSMTIEHAKAKADMSEFSFQQIEPEMAWNAQITTPPYRNTVSQNTS